LQMQSFHMLHMMLNNPYCTLHAAVQSHGTNFPGVLGAQEVGNSNDSGQQTWDP